MYKLKIPLNNEEILKLRVGDSVSLSGVILTGRDAVHKWMAENFIRSGREKRETDQDIYDIIKPLLNGGVIYHCGPIVTKDETDQYHFVAAGPTTSIREEPYQAEVMAHFNIKGVIGKGGMGAKTLAACQKVPGVYLHAIGGAAAVIAKSIRKVCAVYKMEFGIPEAIWVIDVEDFPAVVTMDAHGASLHANVENTSRQALESLLAVD